MRYPFLTEIIVAADVTSCLPLSIPPHWKFPDNARVLESQASTLTATQRIYLANRPHPGEEPSPEWDQIVSNWGVPDLVAFAVFLQTVEGQSNFWAEVPEEEDWGKSQGERTQR